MAAKGQRRVKEALQVLQSLGLPRAQQNDRSALSLLALLDLTPRRSWREARNPLLGITPIMDWVRTHYDRDYAPNSRETFRRQTIHQFRDAGIVLYNPDRPDRAVNSPHAVYQVAPRALELFRSFGSTTWHNVLTGYLAQRETLIASYAKARQLKRIPVSVSKGATVSLSPGAHSDLIGAVIEEFAPMFAPGSTLLYAGDTESKWGYFDAPSLARLGVEVDAHGKMPDVVLHYVDRNWLLLVEAVTSHGPVDGKRHAELARLFEGSSAGLVYVTAFPSRSAMARHIGSIAWETEVWAADAPTHLIHFNGSRFLGPYGVG